MRKVDYAPAIPTTDGNFSKVEVRVMFVWRDGKPFPVTTLARLSQGKMMGVDVQQGPDLGRVVRVSLADVSRALQPAPGPSLGRGDVEGSLSRGRGNEGPRHSYGT